MRILVCPAPRTHFAYGVGFALALCLIDATTWAKKYRVVPATDLMSEATKLALQLANGPTQACGGVKKPVMMSLNDTPESPLEWETRVIAEMSRTSERNLKDAREDREDIKAFVEKRKPNFIGEQASWLTGEKH